MRLLRAVILALVTLAAAVPAQAQDAAPRGNISGFGVFGASASDGLDGGHGFGLSGALFFSPVLGVEGGYRRQTFDVTGSDGNAVSGGELAANVITVNVVGRFAAGRAQPWASGGVAFISNDYSIDAGRAQDLARFNFTALESFDSTVGFNVAGGVDFRASTRIGIFVEGRFIAATADTVGGLIDDVSQIEATAPGTQEMNLFTVSGGIRIFF